MSLLKRPDCPGASPFGGEIGHTNFIPPVSPVSYVGCRDRSKETRRDGRFVTVEQFGTGTVDQRRNGERGGAGAESVTDQLARVIAHDLSQPLKTIIGFSDLLARRYKGEIDEDADEFLAFIVAGAKRMQAMLDDLRTYLSVGETPPPAAPVDCSKVVQAAVDSLATTIADTSATVTVGPLPHVHGDSVQIGQLFRQLLSNALKFSGEHAPRISVSAAHEGGQVRFSVADNGRGMEPSWSERAFELFETLHGASELEPGTGAGLAICRRIVERHGGQIWFEPGAESGSRFHFTIPDRTQRLTALVRGLRRHRRYLARLAIVCGAYFGTAKLGLALAFEHSSVTAIWPPTGIALAATLLVGLPDLAGHRARSAARELAGPACRR